MAWSQSNGTLAQALQHFSRQILARQAWAFSHKVTHTKLHKLTQHTKGHTQTPTTSQQRHGIPSTANATPVQYREHTQAAHSLSMKHTAAAANQCVQQSAPALASTLRNLSLSHTLSVRCPYVYPQSPARVPGCCCALATVSSRKRVMYRLRQQRSTQAGHPERQVSLPGLCVHTTNHQPSVTSYKTQPLLATHNVRSCQHDLLEVSAHLSHNGTMVAAPPVQAQQNTPQTTKSKIFS